MPHQEEHFESGALIDIRSEEEKLKDFKFEEIVTAPAPVIWTEKPQLTWRKFPIFTQNGSGSCVAQTMAKLMGILYWLRDNQYVHFSATHLYQRRQNKPQGGMAGVDAFNIAREGVTLEVLSPSQGMTDTQMDSATVAEYKKDVAKVFKIGNYVLLPIKDIETVASVIQTTKKAVMIWIYFDLDEWTDVPTIKNPSLTPETAQGRHSVAAVDWTLYQGKKALIVEDSWGQFVAFGGQRVITEDFFKVRNFFAAYPMSFTFEDQTVPSPKPQYNFTKILEFGMENPDVKALQEILRYEGLYPANISITSYYGAITSRAVLAWQKKHNVAPLSELDLLQGRRFGEKSRMKINSIYNT